MSNPYSDEGSLKRGYSPEALHSAGYLPTRDGKYEDSAEEPPMKRYQEYPSAYYSSNHPHFADSRYYSMASYQRSVMSNPYELDYIVSLPYFQQWYMLSNSSTQNDISMDTIKEEYDKYRAELEIRFSRGFVLKHINEEWFKELYDPTISDEIWKSIFQYRNSIWDNFRDNLRKGRFDLLFSERNIVHLVNSTRSYGYVPLQRPSDSSKDSSVDSLESDNKALENEKVEEKLTSLDTFYDSGLESSALFIPCILTDESRFDLLEIVNKIPGFKFLSISRTIHSKMPYRKGWIIFENENLCAEALRYLNGTILLHKKQKLIEKTVVLAKGIEKDITNKPLPELMSTPENVQMTLDRALQAIDKLESHIDEDKKIYDIIKERINTTEIRFLKAFKVSNIDNESKQTEDILEKKRILDICVEYLREVHSFCLYCVIERDSLFALTSNCHSFHCRCSITGSISDNDISKFNDFKESWDSKFSLWLKPKDFNLKELGGMPVEEAVQSAIYASMKEEGPERYRCTLKDCAKLFKGPNFLEMHIRKRHQNWVDNISYECTVLNRYLTDATRMRPPKVDAPVGRQSSNHAIKYIAGMKAVYLPSNTESNVNDESINNSKSNPNNMETGTFSSYNKSNAENYISNLDSSATISKENGQASKQENENKRVQQRYRDLDAQPEELIELQY